MARVGWLVMLVVLAAAPAATAKVGDPVSSFTGGPVMNQLSLNAQGEMPLSGPLAGRILYRFVSDDRAITVDLVGHGGVIEQQVLYLPADERRGMQVNMFLQDAVGSIVGAQKGMIAFGAALRDGGEKYLTFSLYTMRFTRMPQGMMRVLVSR